MDVYRQKFFSDTTEFTIHQWHKQTSRIIPEQLRKNSHFEVKQKSYAKYMC